MSDARESLEALVAELAGRGSPLAALLRAGVAEDEVLSRLSAAGALAHPDVVSLYTWHDGVDRSELPTSLNGMVSLVPSHMEFNPLDEAIASFSLLVNIAQEEAATPHLLPDGSWGPSDPDQIWSKTWFPILQGGGSEWVFINGDDDDAGSVWLHPIQDSPRRLFDSLADAADAVRAALEDGRLLLDERGVFTRDSAKSAGLQI